MTQDEIAAQKRKATMLLGVGVASLIASYLVGYAGPRTAVSNLAAMAFTAIFLGCLFMAGMTAIKLNKEKASK